MSNKTVGRSEFDQQLALLFAEVGQPGSGAARYSAAMYFYHLGFISISLLEIYRRCCKFDFEDPVKLAENEGIKVPSKQEILDGNQ